MGNLQRLFQRTVPLQYARHATSLLDEPVTEQSILGSVVPRNLAFLADPIIAHALLGKERSMYPALPSLAEAEQRGYKLDAVAIATEIRRVLVQGRVQISKADVCRGVGDTLCFSPALRTSLHEALSDGTKSMIREYLASRAAEEGFTAPSPISTVTTEAPPIANQQTGGSSATVASLLTKLSERKAGTAARAGCIQGIVQVAKEREREHTKTLKKLKAAEKRGKSNLQRAWRAEAKERRSSGHKMLGLTPGRKPIEVKNVCFDPSRQREAGQKRKRDPSLAFECAWVMVRGTKEPRPIGGGVRWTVEARVDEFLNFVGSGVESARRAVLIRERFVHQRALRVFVVPIGRKGCLRRNVLITNKQKKARAVNKVLSAAESQLSGLNLGDAQRSHDTGSVTAEQIMAEDDEITQEEVMESIKPLEGLRLFDSPSAKTLYTSIIPTVQLLFSRYVRDILDAENTESIGICPDGCHSKKFGFMGTSVSAFQSIVEFQDLLGGKMYKIVCKHFQLPLMQQVNKKTKELKDSDGNIFGSQAAHNLVKASYVANVAAVMLNRSESIVIVGDGATENCGLGDTLVARENFCSPGSLFFRIMITRQAWPAVIKEAEKVGLLKPLDGFFGNEGIKWPGREASEAGPEDAPSSEDGTSAAAGAPPLDVPLDTAGPVHKDPNVVQRLLTYQETETDAVTRDARVKTLRELIEAADRDLGAARPARPFFGPFKPGNHFEETMTNETQRARLAEHAAHEDEYQRRLQKHRQKALELYEEHIKELDKKEAEQALRSKDPPVSMELNPLRLLPCRCGPDGCQLGEARHCSCHRIHNLTKDFVKSLNKGFLEQGVSASKYFNSDYHWADFRAAINFLMNKSLRDAFEAGDNFYDQVLKLVLEVMELEDLIKQCEFDINGGATPPVTAALTRWGTALEAIAYLYRNYPLLAFAIIKRCSHGLETNKISAAADCLKPCGFDSSKHQKVQLESHAELQFALLTNTEDVVQLAICSAVHELVAKPLLAAVSSDNECGYSLGMGVGSMIRCILMVLRRDISCRLFPCRSWGLGYNWRIAFAFRTFGAEGEPDSSVRILNPNCEDKVRRRFRDFPALAAMMDDAARAIPRLMHTLRILAGRPGEMLPEDSLELWKWAHEKKIQNNPDLSVGGEGWDSYAARISRGQWLAVQVFEDCVGAITKRNCGLHRELFGVSGFMANMATVIKSITQYTIQRPDSKKFRSSVVIPGQFAQANAANALVMGRDLLAHYRNKGIGSDEVLKRLPTYCKTWSEEGMQQLLEYICQPEGRNPSGAGAKVIDKFGQVDLKAYKDLKQPLSFYPIPDKCSRQAGSILNNSKKVESSFSPMTVIGNTKGNALFAFRSMLYRRDNFNTTGMDARLRILQNKDLYWEAQQLAGHSGWAAWVNARDEVLGDLMQDAAIENNLLVSVRGGGDYTNPRHGGSSRTDKYRKFAAKRGRGAKRGRAAVRGGAAGAGRGGLGGAAGAGRGARSVAAGAGRGGLRGAVRIRRGARGGAAGAGRGGAAGAGRRGAAGAGEERGGKRAREISDVRAAEQGIDGDAEPVLKARRVCAPVADLSLVTDDGMDLDGNPAPRRSISANRALSLKRAAADAQRRKKIVERMRQECAEERAALAEADAASALPAPPVVGGDMLEARPEEDQDRQSQCSSGGRSCASASASDADDDSDYEPAVYGDETVSNEGAGRARSIRGSASKRARMRPSDRVDNGSVDTGGDEAEMSLAAQPAAALPPPKGDVGRSKASRARGGSRKLRIEGTHRRSNAQGSQKAKPRLARGSSSESSSSSDEEVSSEDANSDNSDRLPAQRQSPSVVADADPAGIRPPAGGAGIGDADLDTPLALRAKVFAVSVGSRVEIKWDPLRWAKERGGWCQGVVKAISKDGKLRAPGKKHRIVQTGFSIVEYEGGQQFVHLLDKEHHHTFLGDEVDAWRLVSGQDSVGSVQQGDGSEDKQARGWGQAAAGKGGGGGVRKANRRMATGSGAQIAGSEGRGTASAEADSDDDPIWPDGIPGRDRRAQAAVQKDRSAIPVAAAQTQALPATASCGAGGPARQQHNPAVSVGLERNVWSMSFCFDVFRKIPPADFRPSSAKWSLRSFGYTVVRQMPKMGGFSPAANIQFSVQLGSRMYYIAYTEETGVMLFNVQQIRKPRGTDWSETLRGYPVFTTDQALNYVDCERDCRWPGAAPSLGRASLRYIAADDLNNGRKTYHGSDVLRYMDVRRLVGVVRWQTVEEGALGGCIAGTFKHCPKDTDLIRVAAAFSAPAT